MSKAISQLEGEIANDMKLTPGGMLQVNILVWYEGNNGQKIPNYIPVKWFKPESEDILARFHKGQEVAVTADVKMNKRKDEQFYQVNLFGTSIELAANDTLAQLQAAFDADELDPDIPF